MDKLDYGLSEPQMVLMKNGQVFLAGQVQAPMDPPTAADKAQSLMMKMKAGLMPDMGLTTLAIGSSLLGTVSTPTELTVTVRFDKYWPGQAIMQNPGSSLWTDRYQFDYSKRGGDWQNAEFIKVSIVELDASGNEVGEVGSAYTDTNGKAHFPFYDAAGTPSFLIQPTGKKYKVKALSQYQIQHGGNVWVDGVVYPTTPTAPHEAPGKTYQAPGAPLAAGSVPPGRNIDIDLTSINLGGDINSGQRIAGVFNVVWMLDQSFNLLRGVEPSAGSTATINIQWDKNTSPGSLFSGSATPYSAQINGNRNVNSDEYDDAVLGHEFGHFANKLYGRDMNPGGFHDPAQFTYDPCLAFSEGWASFFQAVVRSQSGYCKSGGSSMSDLVMFDTKPKGITTRTLDPNGAWSSDFTAAKGWCNEFSVFRLLWKMHKDPQIFNGDFSKSWGLMKSIGSSMDITDTATWVRMAKSTPGVNASSVDALLTAEGFSLTPQAPYEDPLAVPLGNTVTGQKLLVCEPAKRGSERQTSAYYLVIGDPLNPGGDTLMTLTTTDSLANLDVRTWAEGVGESPAAAMGGGKYGFYAMPGKKTVIRLQNKGNSVINPAINYSVKFEVLK